MRAFLNSFKSSKSMSRKSNAQQPVEEASLAPKKRRFAVPPSIESKGNNSARKSASAKKDENEAEVARENMEVLLDFFNDRLVAHLAIL
jgi:hypothetical protein